MENKETTPGTTVAAAAIVRRLLRGNTSNVRCAKCFEHVVSTYFPFDWEEQLNTTTCGQCRTVSAGRVFKFVMSCGQVFTIVFDPSQYPDETEDSE